jgi:hypothetical protein
MDRHTAEYRLYTAVLREEKKRVAISPAKPLSGEASIEIDGHRAIFKCLIKNLYRVQKGQKFFGYSMWLVNNDRTVPVFTGNIKINKEGRGEGGCSVTAEKFRAIGIDIESFNLLEVRINTAFNKKPGDRVLLGLLELAEVNLPEEPKMEKVSPFGTCLPYYQWWKFYPGFFHNWRYYPAFNSSNSRYQAVNAGADDSCNIFQGHQLVGLQYDDKGRLQYLVHGIPGRFCHRDQPHGGAMGYVFWHPLPGQLYKAGDYGYWLVHIDPVNGEVVLPQKITRPPDCEECKKNNKG